MGQMKELAYKLAHYMYEEGLEDDQIVDIFLQLTSSEERQQAEVWLRQQIQYLKENPYPTRNLLI